MRKSGVAAACLVALALVAAIPRPAAATVMRALGLEALTLESDAIVIATVVRSGSRLRRASGGGGSVVTRTTLQVERWVKGAGGTELLLVEAGGDAGSRRVRVDGVPDYAAGERVLVFLARHPEVPGAYRTYGMAQGKFRVEYGAPGVPAAVRRDLRGVAVLRPGPGGEHVVDAAESAESFEGTVARVEEILRAARRGAP